MSSGFIGTSYILFLAALLGIGDGVLMTQLNALLGMLFKHDMVHKCHLPFYIAEIYYSKIQIMPY